MSDNPFVGRWTYRSLFNDPDVNQDFKNLEFGRGTIEIREDAMQILNGAIGGPGWSLTLQGSREYGTPMRARFQGVGTVAGEKWVYNYGLSCESLARWCPTTTCHRRLRHPHDSAFWRRARDGSSRGCCGVVLRGPG